MSLKVQGSPTTLPPITPQTEVQDTGLTTSQLQPTLKGKGDTQQNQFQVGQKELPAQTLATAKFAQSSNTQTSSGMNVLNLQIAEGQQPLEIAAQSPVNTAEKASQVTAPHVQTAVPTEKVTDPAALEKQRNAETIKKFYTAMQNGDKKTIMSLYHPDATFSDPAFPNIKGKKLDSMWELITTSKPEIQFRDVKANDDGTVTGRWEADYELIKGNPIHNKIDSKFEFDKDGKIIKHTDSFDFAKWADQAIPGLAGKLAGTRVGQWVMQKLILPFAL